MSGPHEFADRSRSQACRAERASPEGVAPELPAGDVTEILRTWGDGDPGALDALIPAVYEALRNAASGYLRSERPDHTLQPTALVHETFLRLVSLRRVRCRDRRHFYALAALLMRRILVDHGRRRAVGKRGGALPELSLSALRERPTYLPDEILEVDEALRCLGKIDPQKVRLVHLRYFAGLSVDETAEVLGCSRATVIRRWRLTKAWLHRELATRS